MSYRTQPMIWNQGKERGRLPCAVCGRPLGWQVRWAVHVIDGGALVLHPEDERRYIPDSGDMGCYMIGPECRKKFGTFAFLWIEATN
jgi:hypothetical protein